MLLNPDRNTGFPLAKADALAKIIAGCIMVPGILFYPKNSPASIVWCALWLPALLYFLRRLNLRPGKYLLRSSVMILFLTLPLPFHPVSGQEHPIWQAAGIAIFGGGMGQLAAIWIKAMLVLLVAMAVVGSSSYVDLLRALKRIHLPEWILAVLLFMFRLFFLLEEEFLRMKRALRSRSIRLTLRRRLAVLIGFSGVYLARLIERSDRSYQAMVSRGFQGRMPLNGHPQFGISEALIIGVSLTFWLGYLFR